MRTYRIFISHAWDYTDEYYRLVNMLDAAPNFSWQNFSVPVMTQREDDYDKPSLIK